MFLSQNAGVLLGEGTTRAKETPFATSESLLPSVMPLLICNFSHCVNRLSLDLDYSRLRAAYHDGTVELYCKREIRNEKTISTVANSATLTKSFIIEDGSDTY